MTPSPLRSALTVIAHSVREGVRRRVFLAVLVLTAGFLALYALGAHFVFRDVGDFAGAEAGILDDKAFAGATIFGLAMFAILFLGAVLAVFLTLGAVRGDAESGLLQPLVVRPIGRTTMLMARFAGAAALSAAYVRARLPGRLGDHHARPAAGRPTTCSGRRWGWPWRSRSSPRSRCCSRCCCRSPPRGSSSSWSSAPA